STVPRRRASPPISHSCSATCAGRCSEGAAMANTIEVKVPDIGGQDDVPVIEVLVAVGDTVAVDQGLATLESDKATMEVPSSAAGVVREVRVKVGDTVSEGSVVVVLEAEGAGDGDGADADSSGDEAIGDAMPGAPGEVATPVVPDAGPGK